MGHEENQHCPAWQLPQERPLKVSSSSAGLIPSNGVGEAVSTGVREDSSIGGGAAASFGKDESQEFKGSVF